MRIRPHIQKPPLPPTGTGPSQQLTLGGADVSVSGGQLSVKGTNAGDRIRLERIDGGVRLTVNGESKDFSGIFGAKLNGKGGDDRIFVDPRLGIPVDARGGAGKDRVIDGDRFDRKPGFPGLNPQESAPPLPTAAALPEGGLDYDALLGDDG